MNITILLDRRHFKFQFWFIPEEKLQLSKEKKKSHKSNWLNILQSEREQREADGVEVNSS